MTVRPVRVVLPAAAAIVALTVAGCSSSKKADTSGGGTSSAPPATSPASASVPAAASTPATAPTTAGGTSDFTTLLIAASDIPVPGVKLLGTQAAPGGQGVSGAFSAPGNRQLGDTIIILPSADAAASALAGAEGAAAGSIQNAKSDDLGLGDAGKIYEGTSAGGTRASALVVFTEGKAFVTMEFDAPKGDAAPDSIIASVVKAQDDKIKANLPS